MEKSKNSKKVIVAVIVIIVIILIIAIGAFLYFTTDLLKGNQELFFKYFSKNGETIGKFIENEQKEIEDRIKQGKYTTDTLVTFNLESNNTQIASGTLPASNFSIEYNAKTDNTNNNKSSQTKIKYLSDDLFTLKYIKNKDLYALKSDEVVNKYLAFDNNNLKEFAKKMGITDTNAIPNKIKPIDFKELLTISEENKKALIAKCLQIINEEIPKEKYKNQKNATINIEDKAIIANAYSLEITPQECRNIIVKVLEAIKIDENMLSVIVEKLKIIDNETTVTTQDVQNYLQNVIDSINSEQEIEGETLKLTVYENNKELIRTEIEYADNKISIDYEKNNNSERAIISVMTNKNTAFNDDIIMNNDYNLTNGNSIVPKLDEGSNLIGSTITKTSEMPGLSDYINVLKIELAKKVEDSNNTKIMVLTFGNAGNAVKVSMQNKKTLGQNIQNNSIINININDYTYITAKIDTKIEQADDIEIEELTKENSAVLNNYSKEYLVNLFNSIGKRLQTIFTKKIEQTGMLALFNGMQEIENQPTEATNEEERQMFNFKFLQYEGENISGNMVKDLIRLVNTNNASFDNKKVNVTLPNQTGQTVTTRRTRSSICK